MVLKNPPLDGLIVLGARINPEGRAGRIARLRVEHALGLWQERGETCCLIITGGCSREGLKISEARAMADHALERAEAQGGPELRERLQNCLVLEEASRTTWESACRTLPLVQDLNLANLGLISDALHLRRARALFRRHYRHHPVKLHPLPVPGVIRHYWQHRRYLWLTKMALRETGAWVKFLARHSFPRLRKK
jgi:hypothetical protein